MGHPSIHFGRRVNPVAQQQPFSGFNGFPFIMLPQSVMGGAAGQPVVVDPTAVPYPDAEGRGGAPQCRPVQVPVPVPYCDPGANPFIDMVNKALSAPASLPCGCGPTACQPSENKLGKLYDAMLKYYTNNAEDDPEEETVEDRLEALEASVASLTTGQGTITTALGALASTLEAINTTLASIDTRLDALEAP